MVLLTGAESGTHYIIAEICFIWLSTRYFFSTIFLVMFDRATMCAFRIFCLVISWNQVLVQVINIQQCHWSCSSQGSVYGPVFGLLHLIFGHTE